MTRKPRGGPLPDPTVLRLELTKIDVAEAHIRTAVWLFFEDAHPVPIYTLASAAREILTTIAEKTGVDTILHKIAADRGEPASNLIRQAHKHARFFKHADRDARARLSFLEDETDIVLHLACNAFGRVTGGMPVEAQVFEAWSIAIAFKNVSSAPVTSQDLIRKTIRLFPGVRTADRRQRKRIGLQALKKCLADPALKMKYRRIVNLPAG